MKLNVLFYSIFQKFRDTVSSLEEKQRRTESSELEVFAPKQLLVSQAIILKMEALEVSQIKAW